MDVGPMTEVPMEKMPQSRTDHSADTSFIGVSDPISPDQELLQLGDKANGKSVVIDVREEPEPEDEDFHESDAHKSLVDVIQAKCGRQMKKAAILLFCVLYTSYFVAAIVLQLDHSCDHAHNAMPLIYLTICVLFFILVWFINSKFNESVLSCFRPVRETVYKYWHVLKWVFRVVPVLFVLAIIIQSAVESVSNLVSLVGWFLLIGILLVCSKAPREIKLRPVLGGFALQFLFAVLILKWSIGYDIFYSMGSMLSDFLSYTNAGTKFVLGSTDEHFFAFKVLPMIIFNSCVITMLYYLGVMQAIISKLAFVMRATLGITAAESLCGAGNVFMGMIEAPIMIRPFLPLMTRSELHAVNVGGFATIAGAVLGVYIMKGIPATHLLTASVMNAPAALAVSKILYPELGRSKIRQINKILEESPPYHNILEAAAVGASSAISLVVNVGANLIAFVALLSFVDSAISWFGAFVCFPQLSFQLICNYALRPLTLAMGVEWKDAGHVAELIGTKTFLNEFYAYDKLSTLIKNREHCRDGPVMSVRSEVISTYALCGFANLSAIGIQLGGLGPMAPNRLGDLAQVAVSALLGAVVTNLMTACVAGLLVVEPEDIVTCLNTTAATIVNSTLV